MIEKTEYYEEFLRYYALAKEQQEKCNVSLTAPYGMINHIDSNIGDDLMEKVELYDVVERAYAGFSQIVQDCFHGWTSSHPYWQKMKAGKASAQRVEVANNWTGKQDTFGLAEWLYVFILHRVCGSAINYALKPSGYHNTLLFKLYRTDSIEKMTDIVRYEKNSFYTSVGYQFPAFPKPENTSYKRGGDYYLCEYAPRLARDLADFLTAGGKKDLREIGSYMLKWNVDNGLRQYHFQYAAIVADIADWFPEFVNKESLFYYGSNAIQSISYLAKAKTKMKADQLVDEIMMQLYADTGGYPYNVEDVCCDFIRYLENYVKPGDAYGHLDLDEIWNSSKLVHPFGRQRAMLELGLVKSFNELSFHPTGDKILKENGLTAEQYKKLVESL
jgi:hypothetical protein